MGSIVFDKTVYIKLNFLKNNFLFNLNTNYSKNNFDLNIKCLNIDLNLVANILNLPISASGKVDINMIVFGKSNNLNGNVTLISTNGSIGGILYDNFNINFDLSDSIIILKRFNLIKLNELYVCANGSFPFLFFNNNVNKIKNKSVDISYSIEDNKLAILKYISNGFIKQSSGKMLLKGSINGNLEKIHNNASLLISNGFFKLRNYIDKITDASIKMSVDKGVIKFDKFSFKSGKGTLNIYGQIETNNFNINNFDIRLITDNNGIYLNVPQLPINTIAIMNHKLLQNNSVGESCFNLRIYGTTKKPNVSGSILFKNTHFTFPGNKTVSDSNNNFFVFPKSTKFDLELKSNGGTKFENSFVTAFVKGFVFINGTCDDMNVNGVIESLRGWLNYFGHEFNILNAKLEILNHDDIYLSAECETSKNSKVTTRFKNMKLFIPRSNISNLQFYLNNNDSKNMNIINTEFNLLEFRDYLDFEIKRQFLNIINKNISIPFIRNILRKTKFIDNFNVSYFPNNDDNISVINNPTFANIFFCSKYSIEKSLSDRIFIAYSIIFNKFNLLPCYQDIEIIYKITNNLLLNIIYGYGSVVQFNDKQFNTMISLKYERCF
jgi:hypothetical protein